jgi:adenine-specific DNA-methyltransferase
MAQRSKDRTAPPTPDGAAATPSDLLKPADEMTREELLELLRVRSEEGIRITFSGREVAKRIARKVQPRISRRITKYSVGPEELQACNEVIEGKNLQAMVTLYRERGQVDLILTDPPYNTGKDFRYNDRWEEDPNDPNLGDLVPADEPGRHTKWMRFMLPRLKVMKDMLKPSGVLAICVDQRELFRLGAMLDDEELFGEDNRVAVINWERSSTRRNDKSGVYSATDYILVYSKDRDRSTTALLDRTDAMDAAYKNPDNDPQGSWQGVSPFAPGAATHPGMVYAIQSPFTGQLHYPSGTQCWKDEKPTIKRWLESWGSAYVEEDFGDGYSKGLLLKGAKDPRELNDPLADDPVVENARKAAIKVRDSEVLPGLYFTSLTTQLGIDLDWHAYPLDDVVGVELIEHIDAKAHLGAAHHSHNRWTTARGPVHWRRSVRARRFRVGTTNQEQVRSPSSA